MEEHVIPLSGGVDPVTTAALDAILAEIETTERDMDARHANSERLKAETRTLRAETVTIMERTAETIAQIAVGTERLKREHAGC